VIDERATAAAVTRSGLCEMGGILFRFEGDESQIKQQINSPEN